MNINFNPSGSAGAGVRTEPSRQGFGDSFKSTNFNPKTGFDTADSFKPTNFNLKTGFGTENPFYSAIKPAYPGFNPNSAKEPFLNTRQDSIVRSNDSLAYSFQGAHVINTSASDCRELCQDTGVEEYRRGSTTDGNLGFQGNAKTGKGGLGFNGSHEENEVCRCHPKNPNQCSVSM